MALNTGAGALVDHHEANRLSGSRPSTPHCCGFFTCWEFVHVRFFCIPGFFLLSGESRALPRCPHPLWRGRYSHRYHCSTMAVIPADKVIRVSMPLLLAVPLAASCSLIEGKRTFLKRTSVPSGGPFCLNYNIWNLPKESTATVDGSPLRRVSSQKPWRPTAPCSDTVHLRIEGGIELRNILACYLQFRRIGSGLPTLLRSAPRGG